MRSHGRAVVAGSVMGWGQPLESEFDLVVFLYLPVELRLESLKRREVNASVKQYRSFWLVQLSMMREAYPDGAWRGIRSGCLCLLVLS